MSDICSNNHGGADTSAEAYESIRAAVNKLGLAVLSLIEQSPSGVTCEDVETRLRLSHQTASARISELKAKGLIWDTGQRAKTRSGRLARIYKAYHAKEQGNLF